MLLLKSLMTTDHSRYRVTQPGRARLQMHQAGLVAAGSPYPNPGNRPGTIDDRVAAGVLGGRRGF